MTTDNPSVPTWVSELARKWQEAIPKFLGGVKDSPSHDLKRMAKERMEAVEICREELLAAAKAAGAPTQAQARLEASKFSVLDMVAALRYAAEGRTNTVKPDLLANYLNKLAARRGELEAAAQSQPPALTQEQIIEVGNVLDHWEQLPNDIRGDPGFETLDNALKRLYTATIQCQPSAPDRSKMVEWLTNKLKHLKYNSQAKEAVADEIVAELERRWKR
jgi:hypothetical protein